MRPCPRLAAHVSTSSSAAALGRGLPKTSTSSSSSAPRHDTGPQSAMMFMQRHRSFVPAAYLSDTGIHRPVSSPTLRRRRRYEPYGWVLQRYLERGYVDLDALLYHPDAPSPVETLLDVMRHRTPCQRLTVHALEAVQTQPRLTSSAGAASFALQTVAYLLRSRCPHLYDTPSVRVLLCQALLSERLYTDAIEVLEGMQDGWITPWIWATVMEAAAEGKVPHSPLLWRLLTVAPNKTPTAGRMVRTGDCVPAEMKEDESVAAVSSSSSFVDHSSIHSYERHRGNRNRNDNSYNNMKDMDMVTLSVFEARSSSVIHLTQGTNRTVWCRLSTAEVGYAEQHYGTLRDERAWGVGALYCSNKNTTTEGVVYGLDARLASRLMLRANVSFSGQASPLIALHILRRYLRSCDLLQKQVSLIHTDNSSTSTSSSDASVRKNTSSGTLHQSNIVHPSPFLLFFKIIHEARDVVSSHVSSGDYMTAFTHSQMTPSIGGLPMIHWSVVWKFFQTLNSKCPTWFTIIPEEAGDLSQYVIDALCRGADPWMSLNVARAVSARHIVDGLEMSLWLLHRLDASHHIEEAREVTKKVFYWLLVDVGIHLLPQLHHHLIPASRVLIRLGLHEELKQFYNVVLDNAYTFSENFRTDFMQVMEDLVCPVCASILPEKDVYMERSCPMCLTVVSPKDPTLLPSFQLSHEHITRLREKRKAFRLKGRKRLHERIYRWSKNNEVETDYSSLPNKGEGTLSLSPRQPLDATSVFKREILGDTVPLIPGVSVKKDMPLFPMDGGKGDMHDGSDINKEDGSKLPFDVRAAMEESSRRLQLQEAARQYALAQRGVITSGRLLAAPPSLLTSDTFHTTPTGGLHQSSNFMVNIRTDGPWTCVWCQEHNSEWGSRVQCVACGAETGPSAPWRHFAYAESGDVMTEIRARVANCEERPVDAVVAAYMLMVYRRAFMLRATPHDYERIDQLIRRLCWLHEKVLAGYLYLRFVPSRSRRKNETLLTLANLFGCSEEAYAKLSLHDLNHNEEKFFQTIFTPNTCKVCFGSHAWKTCPIITRDFSSSTRASINMTAEEKRDAMLHHLKVVVEAALQRGTENSRLVVDAYTTFVKSPLREVFAEVCSRDVNSLSILLSQYNQYRRAAFVLCHIPLHLRDNRTYLLMTHYFNFPLEEAKELLNKRSPLGVEDETHPNFVQVALTCCMCLDERHASFECPRLTQWLSEVDAYSAVAVNANISSAALYDPMQESQRARRLRAQVDGWTSAGPERLHAFYRFLLQRVDTFQEEFHLEGNDGTTADMSLKEEKDPSALNARRQPHRRIDADDLIVYAINKTITKLTEVGHAKGACRLYARTPPAFISRRTTCAMLRMHHFSEEGIRTLLNSSETTSSSSMHDAKSLGLPTDASATTAAASAAAVPMQSHCLLCFDASHSYLDCPELAAQPTNAAKIEYVATQVGGIRCLPDGIRAADAYVYHMYNLGNLTGDMMRAHPSLVRALLRLVRRSFAAGLLTAGVRVLRRIPTEIVPPAHVYTDFWRAAGLPEETIEDRRVQLLAIYEAEGIAPSIDNPPARQTYTNRFVTNLSRTLHDDLCRHCYQHGHTLATCSVFHAEVSFGRDYVAAYRMSMMSEQLDRDWQDAYLLKLAEFFQAHRLFMPYHIVGVTNALNAIASMWSFRGEPGLAMRYLLSIPPAYRRRQAFKHILHALNVPVAEVNQVLANVYFAPDELSSSSLGNKRQDETSVVSGGSNIHGNNNNNNSGGGSGAMAQHLLMPKPAVRDVAMSAVFNHFPAALAALEKSEERIAMIKRRNSSPRVMTSSSSSSLRRDESIARQTERTSSSLLSPALLVMQSGDILALREDFDPVLTELEVAVGMKLGSRHVLFTSAVDILAAAANKHEDAEQETHHASLSSSSFSSQPLRASEGKERENKKKRKTEAHESIRDRQISDTATLVTTTTITAKEVKQDYAEGKNKNEHRSWVDDHGGNQRSFSHGGRKDTFSSSSPHRQQPQPQGKQRYHQQQQQQHYSRRHRFHERQQQQQQQRKEQKGSNGKMPK